MEEAAGSPGFQHHLYRSRLVVGLYEDYLVRNRVRPAFVFVRLTFRDQSVYTDTYCCVRLMSSSDLFFSHGPFYCPGGLRPGLTFFPFLKRSVSGRVAAVLFCRHRTRPGYHLVIIFVLSRSIFF